MSPIVVEILNKRDQVLYKIIKILQNFNVIVYWSQPFYFWNFIQAKAFIVENKGEQSEDE